MKLIVPTKKNIEDKREIDDIKKSLFDGIETVDKLSKIFELKIKNLDAFDNPMSLDPGEEGFNDAIELYIKLNKVKKDLLETYRKLKITEFDIREKEQKIATMNHLLESIDGKAPDQIRELVKKGKFAPVNMALASLFGEAVSGDANAARSILSGLSDWGSSDNFDSEVPQLTVNLNLPEEERTKYIESGDKIPETINITPTNE